MKYASVDDLRRSVKRVLRNLRDEDVVVLRDGERVGVLSAFDGVVKFVSIKAVTGKSSGFWEDLKAFGEVLVTRNGKPGKPVAVLTAYKAHETGERPTRRVRRRLAEEVEEDFKADEA